MLWHTYREERTEHGGGVGTLHAGGHCHAGHGRANIGLRQVERKRAAGARGAAQLDFAAQQAGQLAADSQPQAGAAVLAAGAGVGLLEGFKNDPLFFKRNANARIGDLEGHDGCRPFEDRMVVAPATYSRGDTQAHAALLGEFEGVGEQILEYLLHTLRVSDEAAAEVRIHVHVESDPSILCLVSEWAGDHVEQVGEGNLLGVNRHGAGLDLREVEDIANQVQQIRAGTVNGFGEFDLFSSQIAVRVLRELLAQDQDTVQRCAQLVRHVGQELGLVLGRESQLSSLLFQSPAGLFDLLVFALHLDVLLSELLRFLRQLLVGLLQLYLLRLEFSGELLRLLEQPLCLHRRLDAVEHDADTRRQLFEERQVRGRKCTPGSQLDDRLDLILEEHR